jgi:hypothetical protein
MTLGLSARLQTLLLETGAGAVTENRGAVYPRWAAHPVEGGANTL